MLYMVSTRAGVLIQDHIQVPYEIHNRYITKQAIKKTCRNDKQKSRSIVFKLKLAHGYTALVLIEQLLLDVNADAVWFVGL